MRLNRWDNSQINTFEGGKAMSIPLLEQLKRSVLSCMLWEDQFYEDGVTISDRIFDLSLKVKDSELAKLITDASNNHGLRHVPLLMICAALKRRMPETYNLIYQACTRPDQMTELLTMYWRNGKCPLSKQLKKGLARAFTRFDEYQLAKYNRDTPIKLRDILFLCHAKPRDKAQELLWKKLIDKQLDVPDTWETRLSSGENKKQSFQELLEANKMGKLAIVRNLRNMFEAGVPKELVASKIMGNGRRLLPFQFLAAARECQQWEDLVDKAMIEAAENYIFLPGKTVIFVDVSGSMDSPISEKSKMTRMDAACGLAILLREACQENLICTFSQVLVAIPPRKGMALRDAMVQSQPHSGTYLGAALQLYEQNQGWVGIDRLIIITDEQIADQIPRTFVEKCYMLNIASTTKAVKTDRNWQHIHGFSEACIDYIHELEKLNSKEF